MAILPLVPSFIPSSLAAGAVAATVFFAWVIRWPRVVLALLPLSLLAGQVIRFPLPGQGGGVLLSDIAVTSVLVMILVHGFRRSRDHLGFTDTHLLRLITLFLLLFILWSGFTLAFNAPHYGASEMLIAFSYWLRLTAYLALLPALLWHGVLYPRDINSLRRGFKWTLAGLVVLGLLQLVVLPRLNMLTGLGWDPHQHRLVSTWLDPNFIGLFFVIGALFISGNSPISIPLTSSVVLAVVLTQSRSALLTALVILLSALPFIIMRAFSRLSRPRLVILACVVSLCVFTASFAAYALGERAFGVFTYDPTVLLRQAALKQVFVLAQDNILTGVGYNAYQFAALKEGLIGGFDIHSRAGADNSLLTVWVTTGLPGVILFFLPWCFLTWVHFRDYLRTSHSPALVAALSILALFIHSQFVNSFLYAHLLLTVILINVFAIIGRLPTTPRATTQTTSRLSRLKYSQSWETLYLRSGQLLILLIPAYLLRFNLFGIPTNLFETLVCLAFITGAFFNPIRCLWKKTLTILPRSFIWLVFLFLGAAVISTVISPVLVNSLGILKSWIITPVTFFWIILSALRLKQASLSRMILPLVITGAFSALVSLSQLGVLSRVRGWYDVPNSLALWLAPILVVAVWQALYSAQYRRLYALLSLPLAAALVASQSVGGIIAVVLSLTVGSLFWAPKLRRRLLLGLSAASLATLLVLTASGRLGYLILPLTHQQPNSISVRIQLWDVSLSLIQSHPILGVGLGQFEPAYQSELHRRFAAGKNPLPEFVFRDPHNFIFSFWLNTGLLGLASFLGVNALVLRRISGSSFKMSAEDVSAKTPPLNQGLALALLSILIFGLTDTVYWKNDLAALFWLILALLIYRNKNYPGSWQRPSLQI